MYKLTLEHQFAAAHQLTHAYSKECNDSIHGHNWKVRVNVKTSELVNGMVLDFKRLKKVINELDHKNLNEVLTFEPTAENIAHHLYNAIYDEIEESDRDEGKQRNLELIITIWEADKASVSYTE